DIARVGLQVDSVQRDVGSIREDPGDHYFLVLQERGSARMCQGDQAAPLASGDMFIVDSTRESAFLYGPEPSLQLSVHLPREEMRRRFGWRLTGGVAIEDREPLALAMKAVLAKLLVTSEPAAQAHLVEALYNLFGALLTERATGEIDRLDADSRIVQRANALIALHYRDPSYTTARLAEHVGVSLRRLQRAFRAVGETPHERLQEARLVAVRRSLIATTRAEGGDTVTGLAFGAGFSDLSTFYRAFRKRYGETPSRLRLGP
ncbi:MAG: helix-turn-helix domain-containing protein, partial [Pseudomonadota bacterium]